jgi:hypothetical protein
MIQTLYILWFQGFENAPDVVTQCVRSWKHYNPDWTILLLTDRNLYNYIPKEYASILQKPTISKTHLSDIVRVLLLSLYGGCWTDATTFCNRPLTEWLPKHIQEGFFAFEKPGPDRPISNWFLYAEKGNRMVEKWCAATLDYYRVNDQAHTYFIHHYLFLGLLETDTPFHDMWEKVPKLSANGIGPHYLHEKGAFSTVTDETQKEIDSKRIPLFKLTYKWEFPPHDVTKLLYYLYSTVESTKVFHIDNMNRTGLPLLPSNLKELVCGNNALTSLPALPSSLTRLLCYNNRLTCLPSLPSTLVELNCNGNLLTSLPPLPPSLRTLQVYRNKLTCLPTLPDSLERLFCIQNALIVLPSLPSSLTILHCSHNPIVALPELPPKLEELFCMKTALQSLPSFPSTLRSCITDISSKKLI